MIEPLRILRTAPQLAAFIPLTIPREDMRKVMGPGLAELRAVAAAQKIAVTGAWFTHHVKTPARFSISRSACPSPRRSRQWAACSRANGRP